MEFEQFSNHSDSNFAEVSYDGSKVANQALAETDKNMQLTNTKEFQAKCTADAEIDLVTFKSLVSL